jgi:hypothetical protein
LAATQAAAASQAEVVAAAEAVAATARAREQQVTILNETLLEAAASLQADTLVATQAAAASQAEVVAAAEAAAAAARAQEQQTTILNEDLQCPICLAVMCNAVSLTTCLHKFCEQCITECRRSSSVCPTCLRPYTVQQIQTDHLIRSLIERHV